MKAAYVDSSCVVAIAFVEPGHDDVARQLASFELLLASNLLAAELAAALVRERVDGGLWDLVAGLSWILPDRSLEPEIERVTAVGYLRGADLWHLGCALFVDPTAAELTFVTLDEAQRGVAAGLGFHIT